MPKSIKRKDGKAPRVEWIKRRWAEQRLRLAAPQLYEAAKLVLAATPSHAGLTPEMTEAISALRGAVKVADGDAV